MSTRENKAGKAERYRQIGATKQELTHLYECDYRTLKDWLTPFASEIGVYRRRYTPAQIHIIFNRIGRP